MPGVTCQVSVVRCHVSRDTCHLSQVTNANSHSNGPFPCQLPQYTQLDAAADRDIEPSTMSRKDIKTIDIFFLNFFVNQIHKT